MGNFEKNTIEKLKKMTEEVEIPESLSPENIEKKLNNKNKKKYRYIYKVASIMAACFVLVVGLYAFQNHSQEIKKEQTSTAEKTTNIPDNYDEVYKLVEASVKEEHKKYGATKEYALVDGAIMEDSASSASKGDDRNFSSTNVRQDGVDEGDVVKTDGRYLYVVNDNDNTFSIADTENKLKKLATVTAKDIDQISELYVDADQQRLYVIGQEDAMVYESFDTSDMKNPNILLEGDSTTSSKKKLDYDTGATVTITYDISDKKNPKELSRATQSGYYQSSRMKDGYLYLFSNYYVNGDGIAKEEPHTFIPCINGKLMPIEDICMPGINSANMYAIISAISLDAPDKIADSKALLSGNGELYVSDTNIYYYATQWKTGNKQSTNIQRISYDAGKIKPGPQTSLQGYIKDSFCIDEYKNHLRVVTTVGETNGVYVLNMDLETQGKIEGLAKDERIYSARFMGDTGYFVTFKETDPLFSVDLSDPKNPKILGELKIPGFSEYLHPFGKNKMLGIGMNVDEKSSSTDGVKLTMFDISNPKDIKELDTLVIDNMYATDVFYDYKAALVDIERGFVGFPGDAEGQRNYIICSYNKKTGFELKMQEDINGNYVQATRGVYIDDTLYVVQGNIIEAYSLKDYGKIADLIL